MKKLIILGLVLLMVVVFGTAALAKADVQKLVPFTGYAADTYLPDASGKAIVNNSMGDVVLEITVIAKGLDDGELYTVSLIINGGIWFPLGEFTANANGNGHFHINYSEEDLEVLADNKGNTTFSVYGPEALKHVMISRGSMLEVSMNAVLMEEELEATF